MGINEAWMLVKMSSVNGAIDDSNMYEARQIVQKFIDRYQELDVEVEAESKVVETAKLELVRKTA